MSGTMNSILSRVLSQEIARQEIWGKEDAEMFGEHMNRQPVIQEIKQFMADENISFNQDWYIRTQTEMMYERKDR